MNGPEIATTGRAVPDDVARTAPIAAAGVLVATGAANGVTVTIARSGETREMVELVERVAAEFGLASRIELTPRTLSVRLTRLSKPVDDVLILIVIGLSAILTYGLVILSERVR